MDIQDESLLRVAAWGDYPWLLHGFSTRFGGVSTVYADHPSTTGALNLGWTKHDSPDLVAENRRRLVAAASGPVNPPPALITLRQVHSVTTIAVSDHSASDYLQFMNAEGRAVREGDGLMTDVPGILLGIQTADCVPVLVADIRLQVVAAFHAGWRGTAAGIVERGIAALIADYGAAPADMVAAVGPAIGGCCYTVGEEVRSEFASRFSYADSLFRELIPHPDESKAQFSLDLWEANRRQLLATGIAPERISLVGECTGCFGLPTRRKYFSHRAERGFTGRMMSVIGIARLQAAK
jgi:YfiH family protein